MVDDSCHGAVARSVAVLLSVVSLCLLTACAPVGGRSATTPAGRATSSSGPTERDGRTDDTNSKASSTAMGRQEALERFDAWVRAQPGVYGHGLIATVDDPATTSVTLLWFGTDPWRDRLRSAGARAGVHVRFQQRDESLAAFEAAQKRLIAARARFETLGFTTVSISGISAEPQPLTMEGAFATGADHAALQRLATRIARQPVLLERGSAGF